MNQFLTGLLLALFVSAGQAEVAVPPLAARVTDLTGTLDSGQTAALEARLEAFELTKGSQIVVLVIPSTQLETIEQFGIRVAEAWKIGRENADDGVILLVAKDDRALRIEVGYGLEGALPDAIAKRIIEEVIVPRFKADDFYGGIAEGVERIIGVVEGEPLPEPTETSSDDAAAFAAVLPAVIFGGILRLFFGRLPGAGIAAVLAAGLVWLFMGLVIPALMVGLLSFFLVMFSGGGRGFGSAGGARGGGGFSGGGGGFGGGGASGRW